MMDRPPARSFEDLIVWQKAHAFVLVIYKTTLGFPREERYGLTAQLRRAAVSIAANIPEGFRKRGRADKARLLNVAEGSLEETRYYVRLATDLDYMPHDERLLESAAEVGRLLSAYTKTPLNRRS